MVIAQSLVTRDEAADALAAEQRQRAVRGMPGWHLSTECQRRQLPAVARVRRCRVSDSRADESFQSRVHGITRRMRAR